MGADSDFSKVAKLLCTVARLLLTTKAIDLERFLDNDQYQKTWPIFKLEFLSSVKSGLLSLTSQCTVRVLTIIPESVDSKILIVLEVNHFENGHFWGMRKLIALKLQYILRLRKTFQRISSRFWIKWTCQINKIWF